MTDTDEKPVTRRQYAVTGFVSAVTLVVGSVVTYDVYRALVGTSKEYKESCDEEHGEGEWVLVPANESEWDDTYIGDQQVCVHENSSRAEGVNA